jgi:hypothetical protein
MEHSAGEPTDDLDAVWVRVEEDELIDREASVADREPLDELRGVRAAATDDRDPDAHRGLPSRRRAGRDRRDSPNRLDINGADRE